MDDDKLKTLFTEYNPKMKSDDLFMEQLERKLIANESVKKSVSESRKRNRLAVLAAAITGFVSGVVLTLCYPYISNITEELLAISPTLAMLRPDYIHIMPFAIICPAIALLSYSAYDITFSVANILRQSK